MSPCVVAKTLPSIALAAVLGSALAGEPASGANDAQVDRFVAAVRYAAIYNAMAAGFVARAGPPSDADDAKFQTFMRRVAAQPEGALQPVFANVLRQSLTPAEARQLADFLESPPGRKLASFSVAQIGKAGADPSAASKEIQMTDEERAAVVRFTNSDVYRKYAGLVASRPLGNAVMAELAKLPAFANLKLSGR